MMDRKYLVGLLSIMALLSISIAVADTAPITYKSYVDNEYGFYKIRAINVVKHNFSYENRTLIINQSDTVIWEHDASRGMSLTLVSNQGLWNDVNLKYSQFDYTFNTPGTYGVRIKELSGINQKIIVNPTDMSIPTYTPLPTTVVPTPVPTPIRTPISIPTFTAVPTKTISNPGNVHTVIPTPKNAAIEKVDENMAKFTTMVIIAVVLLIILVYAFRKY